MEGIRILDPRTASTVGARQLRDRRRMTRIGADLPKKAHTDWKAKYEAERGRALDEAIATVKALLRNPNRPKPESPEGRAYVMALQSSVTALELLKEGAR